MIDDVRKAIESRLEAEWADETTIEWVNVPFVEPDSGEWIRISILLGHGWRASLDKLERIAGLVSVMILNKDNTDSRRSLFLADKVGQIFREKLLTEGSTSIRFRRTRMGTSYDDNDKFFRSITISFMAEHKPV